MLKQKQPFIFAVLLLGITVALLFPFLKYYIDPDATSYLTIANRYANGQWQQAVNAIWSPWACWLTAYLIYLKWQPITAAVLVNATAALGILFVSNRLLLLFQLRRLWQFSFQISLALFLSIAVYWQLFNDLWCAFFLLSVLNLQLSPSYLQDAKKWLYAATLAALAYYAKPSALPFYLLSTMAIVLIQTQGMALNLQLKSISKILLTSLAVLLICIVPWVYILYQKYHIVTLSTAVSLNSSWFLIGHPIWRNGIIHLLPPVYNNSCSYWEDPFFVNGPTPQFYQSWALFKMQIVRSCYYSMVLLVNMARLSAFVFPAYIFACILLFSKKLYIQFIPQLRQLATVFLLFPLPFVLLLSEPRYFWYMLPLTMIFVGLIFQKFHLQIKGTFLNLFIAVMVAISFLASPITDLKSIFGQGKQDYENAQVLHHLNIHGSFTSNAAFGAETQSIQRLAYFSGTSYFCMPDINIPDAEILMEMRRYHINYYFCMLKSASSNTTFLNEQGLPFPDISNGKIPGLKIFQINP